MRILILFFIILGSVCHAELRTWTAVNGKEVEAEFVSNSDGQVTLKMKTGKVFKVPLNKLSKADQEFITAKSSSIPQKEKPKTGKFVPPEGALIDDPAAGQLDIRGDLYYKKGSDTPYSGIIYSLYENGQPIFEGTIKDGKPDGLYVDWYENGQKKFERNYKDGKQDGLRLRWFANGQKKGESNWKGGKQDGLLVRWYANGQKNREFNYKDGKMEGLYVTWHENGQKEREENYKDGEMISAKWRNDKGELVGEVFPPKD
ncbi:MAG TPA: hypothetical protein EYG40_07870 [Verrucomicrobia bacterium]|nr:hypothetical protein [Verrucomicrobiales bacterium]HIL54939.1 hypothetical protein [Verrucomicrobiota bacterium]